MRIEYWIVNKPLAGKKHVNTFSSIVLNGTRPKCDIIAPYWSSFNCNSTWSHVLRMKYRIQDKTDIVNNPNRSEWRLMPGSPRFLCRSTTIYILLLSLNVRALAINKTADFPPHLNFDTFHVLWLSDFIFYPKPSYISLHQSFFYSFITILPSESGVTLHYSTFFPYTRWFGHFTAIFLTWSRDTNWKMTATHCMMGATKCSAPN